MSRSYRARTALRIRLVTLINRLELEHAKRRLIEGNFAAARSHMAATTPKALRLRAALLGLRVAPQLFRRLYLAVRRPLDYGRPVVSG